MLQFKSLQRVLTIWQVRLFFFLQEKFGATFFVSSYKDSEVSQNKFIDSYEDIFYHIWKNYHFSSYIFFSLLALLAKFPQYCKLTLKQ
jgi:hypothetical protein